MPNRFALTVLLILFAQPALAADPYQWVGTTSVTFTGNGLGFVGMTTQCRADFGPGARMCTSKEILESDTLNLIASPPQGCWIRPSWTHANGLFLDEAGSWDNDSMSCRGWSTKLGGRGLVLMSTGGIGVNDGTSNSNPFTCDQARPVACCKPLAVGEPQGSPLLPTGVGVLAGLFMLRGVATVAG